MGLKIAINGFGRIGRCVARIAATREDVELVAINDMASMDMMVYLLKNDSVHGTFKSEVEQIDENTISIAGKKVKVFSDRDPKNLKFADCGADMVLECTGVFLTQASAQVHLDNGIEKVLFSAPAKDKETPTFVMGVNEGFYDGQKIVSNASCTTNCLGPVAKVLDDAFGIEKGLMTTIHSYTNDQNILDVKHSSDKRRARAGAINMIPTTTGAAKAISLVMPQLLGKLHGQSVRVPTPDVSMVDLNVVVSKQTTKEEVTAVFNKMAETSLKGIMLIDKEMRVSQDFVGCEYSSIVAEDLTQVIGGDMIKIMAWYDNEWGYSMRLVDMALHISK
ncbi:MAG: type I glyceraldehyde-3-phosphate dehydrogenase [Epsilonproteobacteria bacterium]|nr:type I glyceraldehyde-3-phosphate dehydrogenase [Campylobacterota bacterium]OIO14121.1 MAG: type I glyceraldehyde-3-phosphate dehydrogenase [Helicobacteraceae bacterium CG1_02_36_14]PIP09696.1 MAG: type I glyceraldehyde-3-phosphate dehydrogenase [Sulfurimonas sp. CG23_combo_of_CG06-09_8_20_14_all_36_33]PIS26241.1 MAG: type I glyceraldehyde-3-phosphate dehydrogenase [Sulfurimonas sp. CG08_land_8_20_14_0_20_36_33]PIU34325.1 MAG: type I glyceraldehyde-3-phosphate dehydrogenase [Sulfurimonas sp.